MWDVQTTLFSMCDERNLICFVSGNETAEYDWTRLCVWAEYIQVLQLQRIWEKSPLQVSTQMLLNMKNMLVQVIPNGISMPQLCCPSTMDGKMDFGKAC